MRERAMTAEVAVMNKLAVALAADSAVTFSTVQGHKIYNAANKVFALSKRHPVGVMVYGNAEFMGVPWETIVKVYRHRLEGRDFPQLHDYYEDFLSFLGSDDGMFGHSAQAEHCSSVVYHTFQSIRKYISDVAEEEAKTEDVAEERYIEIAKRAIRHYLKNWSELPFASGFDEGSEEEAIRRYAPEIGEALDAAFQQLPFTDEDRDCLRQIAACVLTRDRFLAGTSGVVVAGFGREEHLPALRAVQIEARVLDRLRYQADKRAIDITTGMGAAIVPFAQSDVVELFLEGIDPKYAELAYGYVGKALREYPKRILDQVDGISDTMEEELQRKCLAVGEALFEEFKRNVRRLGQSYVQPLLSVVEILPKDELAELAEALVNITSLKRKISLDVQTVGGPIDVAVISKGDGLIWVRRKHYFRPELNTHFFENYFFAPTGRGYDTADQQ